MNLLAHIRNLRAASEHADPLPHRAYPKSQRYRSEKWRRAVAELDCAICGKPGPSQAAHRNESKGLGMKTDDCFTFPACVACHTDLDSGDELTLIEKRRVIDRAILDTLVLLVQAGRVVVK